MESFNPYKLAGKNILVTGASSGIGKAIAISCAKMGASVILTGRNVDKLNATYLEVPNSDISIIPADLTNQDDIDNLAVQIKPLDGLVQCAGVGSRIPCRLVTKSSLDEVMNINFNAPVLLQAAILRKKKLNANASVVFIASIAAQSPSIGNSIYSASKGALISYAKCLALELAQRKIRVNCICPAMIWTDLIFNGTATEQMLKEDEKRYPLKRYGRPEDIANLCIYLLSDASDWMTGSSIDLTGGVISL